eukprot:GFUD01130231.1.p1 GENE.GFUD01130231.1~~GFUD01130231.1.p1  ORF type:complete len:199 (+),score=44.90 GFUD01130231.1:52-648(+)
MGWAGTELYYTPGSPHCRAVLMCIKALELDVDLIKLDMYQKYEHKKPWFVKMNPQHTVPTLNDNEYILWESRAILCYLVNKFGSSCPKKSQLYPTDPEMRANVDRLLYFDTGTLYKNIVDYFHPQLMSGEYPDDRKANALKQSLEYIDLFLEKTRNLFAWVEKLKSELPYYEDCNSAGIEMFRAWAKSKNKSYDSKGK